MSEALEAPVPYIFGLMEGSDRGGLPAADELCIVRLDARGPGATIEAEACAPLWRGAELRKALERGGGEEAVRAHVEAIVERALELEPECGWDDPRGVEIALEQIRDAK